MVIGRYDLSGFRVCVTEQATDRGARFGFFFPAPDDGSIVAHGGYCTRDDACFMAAIVIEGVLARMEARAYLARS